METTGGLENGLITAGIPRRRSCGWTPGSAQVSQVALSQESSGRKEAAQQISSQGWQDGKTAHTHTHSAPRRRQNVKAGSGRQLLVLSAWRRPPNWLASGGPMRLNSLKMSKHLRGVRAVPGHDNISLSVLHTVGQTGMEISAISA